VRGAPVTVRETRGVASAVVARSSAPGVKDVAALAGVSPSTVSNYLNRPDVVRPDTKARIDRAVRQLGFVRNESARQLRAGSSRTFALVLLDAWIPFYGELSRAWRTSRPRRVGPCCSATARATRTASCAIWRLSKATGCKEFSSFPSKIYAVDCGNFNGAASAA